MAQIEAVVASRAAVASGRDAPRAPDLTDSSERLAEIAEILAAGLMRLRARKSTPISADPRESSVGFTAHQSGRANPDSPEMDA
jgi:hypothetical protein